ncbi:helix-turn-helix domain-containing protein [Amnibacterium sp.]|uniref:helix-turn-helix domain-containing protein n=1 Tax=Amnibacterium sp. TaxID=1872496 RepID=UPI003F7CC0C5
MNGTRIASLRQQLGWTQERLAGESGVGIRTIQRVEAGHEASLETLSRVSSALQVPVRELFVVIDGEDFSDRVEAMRLRSHLQQRARDQITNSWLWCYLAIGLLAAFLDLTIPYWGGLVIAAYAAGGYFFLSPLRNRVLEPRLDSAYPLSHRTKLTKPMHLPDGTQQS